MDATHVISQPNILVALTGLQVTSLQAEGGRLHEALVSQQTALQVATVEHQMALASLRGSLMADHQAAVDSLAEQCQRDAAEQAETAANQLQAAAAAQAAAVDAGRKAALEHSLQHEAQMQDLQEQLTAVQMLFDNRYICVLLGVYQLGLVGAWGKVFLLARYPRKEDVDRIRELKYVLAEKNAHAAELHKQVAERDARLQRLTGELLLREDNYNKTFANGGAGMRVLDVSQAMSAQQNITDWMLKPNSPNRKGPAAPKAQQGTAKR